MKLVLASKNPGKLRELQDILGSMQVEVLLESQAGIDLEVEETGTTFEENSFLKADAVMRASGLPAIADDSGLMVDALDGAPGIYSARFGGLSSDGERTALLLDSPGTEDCAVCQRHYLLLSGWTCPARNGCV